MSAGIYDFTIEQGTTWAKTLYFGQADVGLLLAADSLFSLVVDGTAKTITRNDGGSWSDDGLEIADYIVMGGFPSSINNGSKTLTGVTATVLTCAGDTLESETAAPSVSLNPVAVLKAEDFTSKTGVAKIRKKYNSTTAAATVTVTFDAIPAKGIANFLLTSTQTTPAILPCGAEPGAEASQYVWAFKLLDGSTPPIADRKIQGTISVSFDAAA